MSDQAVVLTVSMFTDLTQRLERIATVNESLLTKVNQLAELLGKKASDTELRELESKVDGLTRKVYLMAGAALASGGGFGALLSHLAK